MLVIWFRPVIPLVFAQFGPFFVYVMALAVFPSLRASAGWARPGRFAPQMFVVLAGLAAAVALALVLWVHFSLVDLTPYRKSLAMKPGSSGVSTGLLIGLTASVINALREEIMWRGVALDALDAALGPGVWSVLIQGFHFGFAHYRGGFPNGISGALLASLFGIVLGALRRRTRGLLACTLAHVAADATITVIVVFSLGAAR